MFIVYVNPHTQFFRVVSFLNRMKKAGYTLIDTIWDEKSGFEMTFQVLQ